MATRSVRSSSHKSLTVDECYYSGVRTVLGKMINADVITMNSQMRLVRGVVFSLRVNPGANINK